MNRCLPVAGQVSFAEQRVPLGTAHAVLCARRHVGDGPFAVVNADDIYGAPALALLAGHLADGDEHAIVSYRLRDTIVTDDPVTRGTCEVDADGLLVRLVERREVTPRTRRDLRRRRRPRAERAARRHPGVDEPVGLPALDLARARGRRAQRPPVGRRPTARCPIRPRSTSDAEVLLPEVVGDMIAGGRRCRRARAAGCGCSTGPGRCIGVTHADDLPVVRSELALMVGQGLRPEGPWDAAA